MGWKSTIDITREEAIEAIFTELSKIHNKDNNELCQLLDVLGFGDDTDKKWYGHNFMIIEKGENI